MPRDSRYDILFEPVRIGPMTAKNRFFQVPHCNGMGYRDPEALAAMRGVKAEGGWAVVCTEEVEIHPSSDICPYIEMRLWDDSDIPAAALVAEKIHQYGALAGLELAHNGMHAANYYSREVPLGPSHLPVDTSAYAPVQARRMDKSDIREIRAQHRRAALRARQAGYDLIYVYAGHAIGFIHHFLSRAFNDRTDEYGGLLVNRVRILREVIEDTKEAVGDTCAVGVRLSVDELRGEAGLQKAEVEEMLGLIAELPDLWDLTLAGWENDSRTSRFAEENATESFFSGFKKLTSKPVVGVGRYTSVDVMARLVKTGVLDFIGAARPSIADPFLPHKIQHGDIDDIRECIGCNICVSGDFTMSPIRCTQNPSMGEEWRKDWHPERIRRKQSDKRVLIIGAGPAGLECAHALGKRGYAVTLAEAGTELGGRVIRESRLPGLSAWIRVRDYRRLQLNKLPNVEIYFDSRLDAAQVLDFGFEHVVIATGAYWRHDGVAHYYTQPLLPMADQAQVLSPDNLMNGERPQGKRVIVWDDDHYYMGGVLAELLVDNGYKTVYITPAGEASTWTRNTMEQHFIQQRLLEKGVIIQPFKALTSIAMGEIVVSCVFTGKQEVMQTDAIVLVTARLPYEQLYLDLKAQENQWLDAGIESVTAIGDALAPATIAHAVYAGRRYAEELEAPLRADGELAFKRSRGVCLSGQAFHIGK